MYIQGMHSCMIPTCVYVTSVLLTEMSEIAEPLKQSLHKEVSLKLTATDTLVKDHIAKLIRSRVCLPCRVDQAIS